jgi:hypothetical protein
VGGLRVSKTTSPHYQAKSDETRGGRGVMKLEKWADIVYGWPLMENLIIYIFDFKR